MYELIGKRRSKKIIFGYQLSGVKIVKFKVLLAQDVAQSGKDILREAGCELVLAEKEDKELMKQLIADCDAVFSKTYFLDREILSAGKKLKVVGKHGAGIDNVVDLATATELGLFVVRTPLANMDSVAEHTMAAILVLAKNILQMDEAVRRRDFGAPDYYESHDVSGKTLGLIGCGNIGRSLAKKAALGFEMRILAYDPYVNKNTLPEYIELTDDLDRLLSESDYVSLHLNASKENNNFINMERLKKMKPSAFLLNFSRGSNVNEKDLCEALEKKIIRGAALDVFANEPIEEGNPLLSMPNVVLSPHSSALTVEAMDRMSSQGAEGIVDILYGRKPKWCVNYEEVLAKRGMETC
jgi:D-3-phosphoglycerate dehydrogenase